MPIAQSVGCFHSARRDQPCVVTLLLQKLRPEWPASDRPVWAVRFFDVVTPLRRQKVPEELRRNSNASAG